MRTLNILKVALWVALSVNSLVGHAADEWPSRPIRLIVPFDPGAATDLLARHYGLFLSNALKVPVVVENVSGASGGIGATRVLRSQPNGYTFLFSVVTMSTSTPHFQDMGFNPLTDLVPIVRVGDSFAYFAMSPAIGASSLNDLIAMAKQAPGKYSFASSGYGAITHLRGEALNEAAKISLTHIPYKGVPAAVADVIGGRVSLFSDAAVATSMGREGKVKLVAILDSKRSKDFPNVPAITEIVPNFQVPPGWFLFQAPVGTPTAISSRLAAEVKKITALTETDALMGKLAVYPMMDLPSYDIAADMRRISVMYSESIQRIRANEKK